MLQGSILNSDASNNNFIVIGTKQYIPGEEFKLVIRLLNVELDLRHFMVATAKPSITLNNLDGTTLIKDDTIITIFDDRSIMSVIISEAESNNLASGNFAFSIDVLGDGTQIVKGLVQNGLSRITGDC